MTLKVRLILFITITLRVCFAQEIGRQLDLCLPKGSPFSITQYSTKDGLPQSQIVSLLQKGNGSLVISTLGGAVELDGKEFKNITTAGGNDLREFRITDYVEEEDWLLGKKRNKDINILSPFFLPIKKAFLCHVDSDRIYFLSRTGKMSVYEIKTKKSRFLCNTYADSVIVFCRFGDNFYIGKKKGCFKYTLSGRKLGKITTEKVHFMKINPFTGELFFGGPDEVFKLTKNGPEKLISQQQREKITGGLFFSNIAFRSAVEYYLTSSKGLIQIKNGRFFIYSEAHGIPSSNLSVILYYQDDDCLFLGTNEKGLLKINFKTNTTVANYPDIRKDQSMCSIIKTAQGKMLTCSYGPNIFEIKDRKSLLIERGGTIYASLSNIDTLVFAGTYGSGLEILYKEKIIDSLTDQGQLNGNIVSACFKDKSNRIWVGTNNGLCMGKTIREIKPFRSNQIRGKITTIYELSNGNVCFGVEDETYIIDKNNKLIVRLNKAKGLFCSEVRCFYEDSIRKLWIGTYGGGLYCYENGKLTAINKMKNAALDKNIFTICKEGSYLYMTSNNGLFRIQEKKLQLFYTEKINYLIPFIYDEESGIFNIEFNGGFQNNYLKADSGIYFPTLQGINFYSPETLKYRELRPFIEKMFVDDTLTPLSSHVFYAETNSVGFQFSCVNFSKKNNLFYQYMLNNASADKDKTQWSAIQKSNSVNFKLLTPGKYTFSLRAVDAHNDEHPPTVNFDFEIERKFTDTIWFRTGAILIVLLFFSITVYFWVNSRRKKSEKDNLLKKQIAELEIKAIQNQMNPHFIFNSLNSIKNYLNLNDKDNANKYLDHFSQLLRSFLEFSASDFITIKQEIDFLTNYIELEKQRMTPPFDYVIECPAELYDKKIPTNILQPLVENAIKHGINHSDKKCELIISFKYFNKRIVCSIDDNGIGREKSTLINKNRLHTSKGIGIVSEKTKVINSLYNLDVNLKIIDKVNSNNSSIGTMTIVDCRPLEK